MPSAERGAPIMSSAGEASGDLHGATLCRALRALAPGVRPGRHGRRAHGGGRHGAAWPTSPARRRGRRHRGVRPRCRRSTARSGVLARRLQRPRRPRALVAHRLPGVQPAAGPRGAARRRAVVYFIPPQVWAWRPWRVRAIRRAWSLGCWRSSRSSRALPGGRRAGGVRRPSACSTRCRRRLDRDEARRRLGLAAGRARSIGLLPGQPRQEIERLAARMLRRRRRLTPSRGPRRRASCSALAPSVDRALVDGSSSGPRRGAARHRRPCPGAPTRSCARPTCARRPRARRRWRPRCWARRWSSAIGSRG